MSTLPNFALQDRLSHAHTPAPCPPSASLHYGTDFRHFIIEIEYKESARVIKINYRFMYRLTNGNSTDSALGEPKNNTVQTLPAVWAERRGLYV